MTYFMNKIVWLAIVLLCAAGCAEDPLEGVFDVCVEGQAPDAACYAQKRDPKSQNVALALSVALGYIDRHPAKGLPWDWGEGVLMYAMTELHRVTGDARLRAYYKAWLEAHIAKGYEIKWSDSCPPALTALDLAGSGAGSGSGDDKAHGAYRKVVDDVVAYFHKAPRTEQGGISHMGTAVPFVKTLWLDSLFMVGMPIAREGERKGAAELVDAVDEQFGIFGQVLQGAGGLLTHAYGWAGQEPDVYWGRGNAWVTAAGHELLRIRRLSGAAPGKARAVLDRQVTALMGLQDAQTGLWWTVLNRPGKTYLETSAAAIIAYGLARGYRYGARGAGVLPVIRRAVEGVRSRIKQDPQKGPLVTGISGPTTVGDAAYYGRVEQKNDLHFGVGAAILALLESSGLPL